MLLHTAALQLIQKNQAVFENTIKSDINKVIPEHLKIIFPCVTLWVDYLPPLSLVPTGVLSCHRSGNFARWIQNILGKKSESFY